MAMASGFKAGRAGQVAKQANAKWPKWQSDCRMSETRNDQCQCWTVGSWEIHTLNSVLTDSVRKRSPERKDDGNFNSFCVEPKCYWENICFSVYSLNETLLR